MVRGQPAIDGVDGSRSRHRTKRTKGCFSRKTGLAMAFKLMMSAQKKWRKLDGQGRLPEIGRASCRERV